MGKPRRRAVHGVGHRARGRAARRGALLGAAARCAGRAGPAGAIRGQLWAEHALYLSLVDRNRDLFTYPQSVAASSSRLASALSISYIWLKHGFIRCAPVLAKCRRCTLLCALRAPGCKCSQQSRALCALRCRYRKQRSRAKLSSALRAPTRRCCEPVRALRAPSCARSKQLCALLLPERKRGEPFRALRVPMRACCKPFRALRAPTHKCCKPFRALCAPRCTYGKPPRRCTLLRAL